MSQPLAPALEVVGEAAVLPASIVASMADGVRRLALQRDATALAGVAAETAIELVSAQRAQCWLFEAQQELLWSAEGAEHPAAVGLAGHAARTGRPVCVARAEADSRYERALDDPSGTGDERILAVPIATDSGEVHAVVVAVRPPDRPPFTPDDLEVLVLWARHAATLFHLVHLTASAEEASAVEMVGSAAVYRGEALLQAAGTDERLAELALESPWLVHAHWVVVAFVVAAIGFAATVRVTEYASGPAYVVPSTREVVSVRDGVVDQVLVSVGDQVEAGQVLMTLSAETERAGLLRARAEFERTLLGRLRVPGDRALEHAVAEARSALRHAEVLVEGASVRAPSAGVVGDLRTATGRAVQAGAPVATLRDGQGGSPVVRAVVPGKHRPAIEAGELFVLRLDGFVNAPQRLAVAAVSDGVVSAGDLSGLLGPSLGERLEGAEAWVVVEARLPGPVLVSDGRGWAIHDGMIGRADIAVRSKPLLFVLLPVLERVFSHV